jgi:hypothetical protein
MDLGTFMWGLDWIHIAQDKGQQQALPNTGFRKRRDFLDHLSKELLDFQEE